MFAKLRNHADGIDAVGAKVQRAPRGQVAHLKSPFSNAM